MKDVTLFGSSGFIGTHFQNIWKLYFEDTYHVHTRERWERSPVFNTDTLWLISTVHNYNVFEDATLDVRTNLLTLTEGLESHRKNNPEGIFNFVSSWFCYGENGSQPVTENLPCYPKGFYSITKRCAEQLVESYCTTFKIPYRILRYCNVVGSGDKFSAKKNALQYMIDKMQKGEDIEVYGDGRFYRNYMQVDDVAAATIEVIQKGKLNYIYNIGHPDHRLFIDHLNYIKNRIGYTKDFKFITPKEFHQQVQTPSFRMDTMRLRTDTAFQPYYSLDEMLDSLIA